jgi:hypothetical protein
MKLYKFGLPAILAIALFCAAQNSFATVLSSWTFEAPNTPPDVTNNGTGPNATSSGGLFGGTVSGLHASADTDWTTPAGNGSADSYSVNTWGIGDYFQIATSSLGYKGLSLTFDTTGSGTGPKDFKVQASTDGSTFTDIGFSYAALVNGAPNLSWSVANGVQAAYSITTTLPASLDNAASIYLRLVNTSTVAINGGTVGTGGTNRIDNVSVDALAPVVPEPASIMLLGLSALGLLIRRK